jgi:HD-like signal output (HDOD) protein
MATVLDSDQIRAIEKRIEQVYQLPTMPEMGRRIMLLQSDPNAGALQLANIVQLDPSLAAQVIRYASSAYYGYRGRINNIHDAICHVLGYDLVLNLALGLAAGRSFRIPDEGPLGLTRFWEHAILSAVLAQKIGACVPGERRPKSGFSYLCGLLHDFGVLLLGHLFLPEFRLLNKFAAAHPDKTLTELEGRLLGMGGARDVLAMGHARIGAWLMQAWKMPDAIVLTLLEHHNPDYRGEHEVMVHSLQLIDFLLIHAGEVSKPADLPELHLSVLGVPAERVLELTAEVFERNSELLALSKLAANAS